MSIVRNITRTAFRLTWRPWWVLSGAGARLHRPVFILGAHRSGTTVLAGLVGRHPDVAHWSEANRVWDPVYGARGTIDPYFLGKAIHAHRRSAADLTEADRSRIHGKFAYYTWLLRKSRFVNKSPFNVVRVEWLRALFPDCYFVHIHRDGRAVVNSYKTKVIEHIKEGRYPHPPRDGDDLIRLLAVTWTEMTREVEDVSRRIAPEAWYHLTYEQLCRDVHGCLRGIFEFCKLDAERYDFEAVPGRLDNRNYKWESSLDDREKRVMLEVLGERLDELGYDCNRTST